MEAARKRGLAIHAYVWMTNQIHLLATPGKEESVSKVFQSVGRRCVQHFNYTYQRSGTLWEGRYRATVVDSEQYLLTLMRDIELKETLIYSSPRRKPGSRLLISLDSGFRRNDDS